MKRLFTATLAFVILLMSCGCSNTTLHIKSEKLQNEKPNAAQSQKYDTYTGLAPLPHVKFDVPDPSNEKGLSQEKICHSFGISENGKPHQISVDSQNFFETKGLNAITYSKNKGKTLYLTFDCGYENGYTAKILDTLKEKKVPAAFFCTYTDIKDNPELIARVITEGHIVGNHSTTHPSFAEISRTKMAEEIEKCDNLLREKFGYTSRFFRFPKGEYSENAIELVNALGYKCVFWSLAYNDWNTENQRGGDYAFDTVKSRLHPGAIILLHSVSADNANALGQIIDYARREGYSFKSLEDL
ncbi:MAG: polysaccharide deacetylase family protein [Clostridia bacterium]|nr:polysaccharide deacetylase family protein [Clostridia bacterium]